MQPAVVIAESFWMWPVWLSLNLMAQSHVDRLGPKIISYTLYHTEFYHKMTLKRYLHTATITFFLSFNVLGRMHNRSSAIIVSFRVLASQSDFSESSFDFDSNQNGRLRLTPPPVSTPTSWPWSQSSHMMCYRCAKLWQRRGTFCASKHQKTLFRHLPSFALL